MPLPTEEKILALSHELIKQFDTIFGLHPGFGLAHAKGLTLTGTFTPSHQASSLTQAAHIQRASTPVTARFSNSTGIPLLPDNDSNADRAGSPFAFILPSTAIQTSSATQPTGFPPIPERIPRVLEGIATSDPPSRPIRPTRSRSRNSLAPSRRGSNSCKRPSLRLRVSHAKHTLASRHFALPIKMEPCGSAATGSSRQRASSISMRRHPPPITELLVR